MRRCCGVAERRVPRAVIHNVGQFQLLWPATRSLHPISAAVLFLAWCNASEKQSVCMGVLIHAVH